MDKTAQQYRKPNFCDLIITETCMLKCRMCNMWQSKNNSESPEIDVWKTFIDSFADFVENKAHVQFVGGEPLIKNGLLDFIRHTARKGLSTTMTTNGYLIDKNVASDIAGSGLNTLVFSLDSIRKETHDFLRGVNGIYGRVMNAIELLCKLRNDSLRIHIVTTIMQQNLDDLLELTEWVNKNDVIDSISFQAVMQPFFTPQDNDWYKKEEFLFLWPKDMDKVDYVLDSLAGFKDNGYKINNPVPPIQGIQILF